MDDLPKLFCAKRNEAHSGNDEVEVLIYKALS